MNDKQSTYDSMMQRVAEYDDEDAFKYIFDDLYAPLCLYARRMVPPGAAEDIAQEVFVALWENRNDITIETSLKGWLLTGTRNRCLNYIKRQAVRDRYNSYAATNIDISVRPDDLLGVSELELRLEQRLTRQSPWQGLTKYQRYPIEKEGNVPYPTQLASKSLQLGIERFCRCVGSA